MLKSTHIISRVSLGLAIAVAAALHLGIFVSPSKTNHASPGSPRSGSAPAPDTAAVPLNCDKSVGTTPAKVHPGCFDPATGEVSLPAAVKQLVVIGDLHGDITAAAFTLKLLGVSEMSDTEMFALKSSPERSHPAWKYIGGPTMMVFLTGDYMDRGPHGADIVEMLLDLAAQARQQGTNVHLLMGNHEYWQFDRRNDYNHIDELINFLPADASRPAWDWQRQSVDQYDETSPEHAFFQKGIVKRANELFISESGVSQHNQVLARMISDMPLLIKVGPILISHAGVTAELAKKASDENRSIATYVQEMKSRVWPSVVKGNMAAELDNEDTSVIYNRKLIKQAPMAKKALVKHNIRLQLIGHTPQITELNGYEPTLIDDHVIVNDLALSMWMFPERMTGENNAVGGLIVNVSHRDNPIVYAKTKKGTQQVWPKVAKTV